MTTLFKFNQSVSNKDTFNHNVLAMVIGAVLLSMSSSAMAVKEEAGKTIIAKGNVYAKETGGSTDRKLKRRSPIYGVDVVSTDENSITQLRMTDGGMIALKENSELLISDYKYNATDKTGSVVMELVKGGLRSVTGAIKSDKGNYQLKTPVGSIGIRGTHYEIEIIQGEVFIAVWDGAVDVNVEVGSGQDLSLGEGEDYSYAKIDESGEVTELLAPPENFTEGHSSDPEAEEEEQAGSGEGEGEGDGEQGSEQPQTDESTGETTQTGEPDPGDEQTPPEEEVVVTDTTTAEMQQQQSAQEEQPVVVVETPITEEPDFVEDTTQQLEPTPAEKLATLIAARTGSFTYNKVSDASLSSGNISSLQASMTINFDTATIPTGHLSFTDSGGEWFAAFNGIINVSTIELGVNFASHGNKLAKGDINAYFIDGGIDAIQNSFNLWEINNPERKVNGLFKLR